jgi:O-antigen ligase
MRLEIATGRRGLLGYLVCIVTAESRGIGELLIGKTSSYIIQLAALLVALIVLWPYLFYWCRDHYVSMSILIFTALASVFFSDMSLQAYGAVLAVNIINLLFLVIALGILSCKQPLRPNVDSFLVIRIFYCVLAWVVFFGYLDFFDVVDFPGDSKYGNYSRAAGSLGSKQHLSLVLGLLVVMAMSIRASIFILFHRALLLASIILLAICFTRIGYFVVIMSILSFVVWRLKKARTIKSVAIATVGSLILSVGFLVFFPELFSVSIDRLFQIDPSEMSNMNRFYAWGLGWSYFTDGIIVLGSNSGFGSQIPSILFNEYSLHFESGQLQYLVNYGLIFFFGICYYFYLFFRYLPLGSLIAFAPPALWLSLFIYMSNEIVPVFVLFPLLAFIAVQINTSTASNSIIS